ncbi:MAG: type II secretion system ATPase GspE [Alphaproteobacteria bacterium]|nr:type II secretion system ATPase GspE [Alphaproteobacteria bacterium]
MAIRRDAFDDTLRRRGIPPEAVERARALSEKQGVSLRRAVVGTEGVDPKATAQALSELSGLPVLESIDPEHVDPELVRTLPLGIARDRRVLPLWVSGDELVVAIGDLSALPVLDALRLRHALPVRPVLVPTDILVTATNATYDKAAKSATQILSDVDEDGVRSADDDLSLEDAELLDDPNHAPIIRFVNALLSQAIKERASDIHIEPFEKDLVVRFRIDGVMHERHRPPFKLRNPIVSRIKIMAGLNIAEKRLPQDGRIRRKMGGREIDLRVSTVPVRHGERVVMRILEKGTVFSLDQIGMEGDTLTTFRKVIRKPHGILLVSGPTGSGKSTTLYSAISEINEPDINILTIEDPVEYEVAGIGQVQVNQKIDLTFASALRSFLRQDPDVILVGEIRDRETAENAVQASLTGHMVFSTIHTNDAAGAFARLTDMGVEPFLVASSLAGVLAQRLVRRLCPHCKRPYTPTDEELVDLGLSRADIAGHTIYEAVGCEECQQVGYKGRLGIYEFLPAWDDVKTLVIANADAGKVKKKAVELGMRTLRDDGFRKVMNGMTSLDEVMRVTQIDTVENEG